MLDAAARSEAAAIQANLHRIQRLLPVARREALNAKGSTNSDRAVRAIQSLERSEVTLRRRAAELGITVPGVNKISKKLINVRASAPKPNIKKARPTAAAIEPEPPRPQSNCPDCNKQVVVIGPDLLLRAHRTTPTDWCPGGVAPTSDERERANAKAAEKAKTKTDRRQESLSAKQLAKAAKRRGATDAFARRTAWAIEHAVSGGLPGLGKRR